MLYAKISKAWKWWKAQQCPSGYKWVPKTKMKWVPKVKNENVKKRVSFAIDNVSRITNIVQLIIFIIDSRCTKHMPSNLKLLCNFVEKYMGTIRFGNDQFAPILGYGELVQGNITINMVFTSKSLIKISSRLVNFVMRIWRDGKNLDKMKEKGDLCILASNYDNSGPVPQLQNVSPSADTTVLSEQELDLLFGPMYDEFFTADPKMYMFALTVSTAEPKTIKEAMVDSAWIEAMHCSDFRRICCTQVLSNLSDGLEADIQKKGTKRKPEANKSKHGMEKAKSKVSQVEENTT
ncbi:hypothetical protein Tco_1282963 [Tanacetum coccineum]